MHLTRDLRDSVFQPSECAHCREIYREVVEKKIDENGAEFSSINFENMLVRSVCTASDYIPEDSKADGDF